jgi:hypothetical protein
MRSFNSATLILSEQNAGAVLNKKSAEHINRFIAFHLLDQ